MVNVVEPPDLREERGERLVVVASVVDGPRPVVAPLDHGAGLEAVRTDLVNVRTGTGDDGRPIGEGEHVLQVTRA